MGNEQAIQPDEAPTVANAKIAQLEIDLAKEKKLSKAGSVWITIMALTIAAALIFGGICVDTLLDKKRELETTQLKLAWETKKSKRLEEFEKNAVEKAQEYYLKAGGDVKCTIWDAEKQAFVEPEKMPETPGALQMSGVEAIKYVFGDQYFENALRDSARIQPMLDELNRYELHIIPLQEKGKRMFFLLRDGKVLHSDTCEEEKLKENLEWRLRNAAEASGRKVLESEPPKEIEILPPTPEQAEEAEYDFSPKIEMTFFNSMSQDDAQKMLTVLNEQRRQYRAELNKLYREKLELEKKLQNQGK